VNPLVDGQMKLASSAVRQRMAAQRQSGYASPTGRPRGQRSRTGLSDECLRFALSLASRMAGLRQYHRQLRDQVALGGPSADDFHEQRESSTKCWRMDASGACD
jgi:hypothetical protein